jgi:hypothetical protein
LKKLYYPTAASSFFFFFQLKLAQARHPSSLRGLWEAQAAASGGGVALG